MKKACNIDTFYNAESDNIFTTEDIGHIITFTYIWQDDTYYRDKTHLDQKIETLTKMRDECIAVATRDTRRDDI